MPNLDELYQELVRLPRRDYANLINRVDGERQQAVEREERQITGAGPDRDGFAHWIGRRHFSIDKGITKILYLPDNSPDDEVRLLEVNSLAAIPEDAPVEAVDFMPDVDGVRFKLYVADVTPRQYEAIVRGEIALPGGWSLKDSQEVTLDSR